MGAAPAFLTLDQGSHASRAIVFDSQGATLAQASLDVATRREGELRVEHDADELAASVTHAMASAIGAVNPDRHEIQAAGLATQRSTIVCWDAHGMALSPAISWADRRNADYLEQLSGSAERVRELTGLPLSAHYGASKMRWCLDHIPAVAAAARAGTLCMGPLSAFLIARLTGNVRAGVDPANGSRTLLYGLDRGDWHDELLNLFGIERAWLPSCTDTRGDFGTLAAMPHAPLSICTGDQGAVASAFGEETYINLGTGAFLLSPRAQRLLQSLLYRDAKTRRFAVEGTVNGAGAALSWLGERIGIDAQPALIQLDATGAEPVDLPIFVNAVGGVGSPFWLAHAVSRFLPDAAGNPATLLAAVLESIAFLLKANLDEVARLAPRIQRLWLTGGLSRSNYLAQAIADLCGIATVRAADTEATARGLARMLGASCGEMQEDRRFEPRPQPARHSRYERWLAVMLERP